MDKSFNELHGRFTRMRDILSNMQHNQLNLQKAAKSYHYRLKDEQERYATLEKTAQDLVKRLFI
jgi:hypothetical protein